MPFSPDKKDSLLSEPDGFDQEEAMRYIENYHNENLKFMKEIEEANAKLMKANLQNGELESRIASLE